MFIEQGKNDFPVQSMDRMKRICHWIANYWLTSNYQFLSFVGKKTENYKFLTI